MKRVSGRALRTASQVLAARPAVISAAVDCRPLYWATEAKATHASPTAQWWSQGFAKQPSASEVAYDHEHVNIDNEVDKELLKAKEENSFRAILKVVQMHGDTFGEGNVTTSFEQLAELAPELSEEEKDSLHSDKTFQSLVDMVILGRRRYGANQLVSIIKSAAKLDFMDEQMLDRISQHILPKIDNLNAQDITDLVSGLSSMDHSPSIVLFDSLQKRAKAIAADFNEEQKATLDKAYKKLDYGPPKI